MQIYGKKLLYNNYCHTYCNYLLEKNIFSYPFFEFITKCLIFAENRLHIGIAFNQQPA